MFSGCGDKLEGRVGGQDLELLLKWCMTSISVPADGALLASVRAHTHTMVVRSLGTDVCLNVWEHMCICTRVMGVDKAR